MAYTRIQRLTGTTAEWAAADPILLKAEAGYEETTSGEWRVKLGDGASSWSQLPYAINFSGNLADIQTKLDAAIAAKTAAETSAANSANSATAAANSAQQAKDELAGVNASISDLSDESTLPHKVKDVSNNKTFKMGLQIKNGKTQIVYEEAV